MPLLISLVFTTCVPKWARSKSKRPSSRDKSACEATRFCSREEMAASRVWRVAREARMEAREEASKTDDESRVSPVGNRADAPFWRPEGGIG